MGPDTQIGWWAPSSEISTTSSGKTINLTGRITNFIVTPSEFSKYTGSWYCLNNQGKLDGLAFVFADPQLEIKAENTTIGADPSNN